MIKIKEYLQKDREEKRKVFDEAKGLKEEERKEFIRNYRKNRINVFDKMVEDKVINEEQAKTIKELMHKYKKENKHKNKR